MFHFSFPPVRGILGEREPDIAPPTRRAPLATASRDDDELPAIHVIDRRRRIPRGRQHRLPQHLPCRRVERTELLVVVGGADEDASPGRHYGAAIVLAAGVLHA